MSCELDTNRPCSSASRAKNRYTRTELEGVAKNCRFKLVKRMAMDHICQAIVTRMKQKLEKAPASPRTKIKLDELKKLDTNPFPGIKDHEKITKVGVEEKQKVLVPPKPKRVVNLQPRDHADPKQAMFLKFKEYFSEDLLGFMETSTPRFRIVTAGGYGLKTLVEEKHKMIGKVKTGDVDFTVSTYKSSMSPLKCFQYWNRKLHAFFNQQSIPSDFRVKVINFGRSYVPVLNFHRYYVLMVTYKGDEFVDVAITNQQLAADAIDKETSIRAGIPVKTEDGYLKEFLSMIYMENVCGVNAICYAKRNPISGKYTCKGVKDINRAQLLCNLKTSKKYVRFCKLLEDVTVERLKAMTAIKRNTLFAELKEIIRA